VLTKDNFRFDINPTTGNIFVGDICICLYRAKQQAKEYGNSIEREVTYLAVHGLLHLLGYDHMIDSDKTIMRKAEEDIMTKINLERE
jgi:probable rRNA maturation factor